MYYWTVYLIPLIAGSIINLNLAARSAFHFHTPVSRVFFFSILVMLWWMIAYGFELSARSFEAKILWANLQFVAIGAAPILWLCTTLKLIGRPAPRRVYLILLSAIPLITVILAFTNPLHGTFRLNPRIEAYTNVVLLNADYGNWHNFVFVPFQYILFGLIISLLIQSRITSPKILRSQYSMLIIASAIPLIASLLYVIGVPPFQNFNPTSPLFAVTGLVFSWSIYRHKMLDIVPLARDSVVENLPDGVVVLDNKNRILDFNTAAEHIFPRLERKHTGVSAFSLFSEQSALCRQLEKKSATTEDIEFHTENFQRFFQSVVSPVTDRKGTILGKTIVLTEITDKVKIMEHLKELASVDDLTGLDNRRSFFQKSHSEFERLKRTNNGFALIVMDLDHFKKVNDAYGHDSGDTVLQKTAQVCKDTLRTSDISARYGGEEFVFFLSETSIEEARNIAERIRIEIEALQFPESIGPLRLTASLGVSGCSLITPDISVEELLKEADTAMYRAKQHGRNCVCLG
jgi:diguanylate cyclase (GGDEF)-like protein/PAS domain S-box-containing protein